MYISRYNSEFKVADHLYIFNALSGALNRIESRDYIDAWNRINEGQQNDVPDDFLRRLKSKGFIYETIEDEQAQYNRVRNIALRHYGKVLRCHIVLTYNCNLDCVYCFEKNLPRHTDVMSLSLAEKCMKTIKELAAGYDKVELVLFGGEPLLCNEKQLSCISYIVGYADEHGWIIDIISNGVNLMHFLNSVSPINNLGQIQLTIDGPKEIHDLRKPMTSGLGSFDKIVASIDAALDRKLNCVVRINVDKQNIESLPVLNQFIQEKGWFKNAWFGAYIGLTYDFLGDYEYQLYPFDVLKRILDFRLKIPSMRSISLESWEPLQFILYPFFKGEPRLPKFYFCSAQNNEINFDLYGRVYFCADSVGRDDCQTGIFTPELSFTNIATNIRQNTVEGTTKPCSTCPVELCCGGGCWFRRYLSKSNRCTEFVYEILKTTLHYLHYHPEVFSQERLTAPRLTKVIS